MPIEDRLQLGRVDRLALQQRSGDLVEGGAAVVQDPPRLLLAPVDHGADFLVDLARGLLAPRVAVAAPAGQERAAAFLLEADAAEPQAHAKLGDHLAADLRGALEVAGAAVGDLAVDD